VRKRDGNAALHANGLRDDKQGDCPAQREPLPEQSDSEGGRLEFYQYNRQSNTGAEAARVDRLQLGP
jgi:hypothetical protein